MTALPKVTIEPVVEDRAGELVHGLKVAGMVRKDFRVGPLTHAAEMASLPDTPDWIEPMLVYQVSLLGSDDAKLTAVQKTHKAAAKALPDNRRSRGLVMLQAIESAQLPFRVTFLGGLPPDQIPDAVKMLTSTDRDVIAKVAEEVDTELAAFPEKSKSDDSAGSDSVRVESRDDAPSGPPAHPRDGV